MNRSTKLLMAAGLIAAGYGVATLIGSPKSPYVPRPFSPPAAELSRSPDAIASTPQSDHRQPPIAGVRLLPQVAADQNVIRPADDRPLPITPLPYPTTAAQPLELELLSSNVSGDRSLPASANTLTTPTSAAASVPPNLPLAQQRETLQAHFTDAQPRAMRNSSENLLTTSPQPKQLSSTSTNVAPPPWPEVPANATSGRLRPLDVPAAYLTPVPANASEVRLTAIVPPPLTAFTPLRTHRVIDGDSLPKLAKRYLQDIGRADEIFALNREQLTSPDLLPIGAELKLPALKATAPGG